MLETTKNVIQKNIRNVKITPDELREALSGEYNQGLNDGIQIMKNAYTLILNEGNKGS